MSPDIQRLVHEFDARMQAEEVSRPGLRLPFNGTLSADEQRMLEQCAFDA